MHAVQNWKLEKITECMLKKGGESINLTDSQGNTALFHAVKNFPVFKKLLEAKMDYNHVNNDGDSLLLYACKKDKLKILDLLIDKPDINVNLVNNVGKTLAMLLVENSRYNELKTLVTKKDIDVNYRNKFEETLVSLFIKKFYQQCEGEIGKNFATEYNYYKIKNYGLTLKTLINLGCDFNCEIDGDGNTPIMFYLMIKDYISAHYLLSNTENVDLSIKNKYGYNATYLSLFMKEEVFDQLSYPKRQNFSYKSLRKTLLKYPTFDYGYLDQYQNNLLIHSIVRNDPLATKILKNIPQKLLNEPNCKKENVLIIAAKLGNNETLEKLLECELIKSNVNYKDELGNTALFYAVKLKDKYAMNLLTNAQSDIHSQNNDGLTPVDAAKDMDDSSLLDLLEHPVPKEKLEEKKIFKKIPILKNINNLDEKLDDYIKNYRVSIYQEEYNYLLKNDDHISYYRPSPYNITIQQWLMEVFFPNANGDITVTHKVLGI